jgi:hypothetical protein
MPYMTSLRRYAQRYLKAARTSKNRGQKSEALLELYFYAET